MKRAGLKVISYDGSSFPAINGGKWNLASNYSFKFQRILTECGIEDEDGISVILLFRYLTNGRMFYLVKRNIQETDHNRGYDALCMYVDNRTKIDNSVLTTSLLELIDLFGHPEFFAYKEILEDSLPVIFRQDYECDERNALTSNKPMSGNRIGYLEFGNPDELDVILSAGYNESYDNFGFILLTDNPVRIESSLPRLFLPELILHRQLSKPKLSFVEEESAVEEEEEKRADEAEKAEKVEEEEEKRAEEAEKAEKIEEEEREEAAEIEDKDEERIDENSENEGKEQRKEQEGEVEEILEVNERKEEKNSVPKIKYFLYGFLTATIIYLIIFVFYETFHF